MIIFDLKIKDAKKLKKILKVKHAQKVKPEISQNKKNLWKFKPSALKRKIEGRCTHKLR